MNRRDFLKLIGGISALTFGFFSYKRITPHIRKFKSYLNAGPPLEISEETNQKLNIFTSNERFFVQDAFGVPDIDIDKWSLRVEGMVRRPLNLTYEEITSIPSISLGSTLECISNPVGGNLVGTALWTGVSLKDILEMAGVGADVKKIVFYGAKGYSDSIPIEKALKEEVILAFSMNEEVLPKEHGYPLRAVVPGIHGMKWVKWITRIEAVDHDYKGYWEKEGWSDEARVDIATKIIRPEDGEEISEGTYSISGLAWGGDSGIGKVEVSLDEGRSWNTAKIINTPASPYVWAVWKYNWKIDGEGKYSIMARATDKEGNIQIQGTSIPFPNGASKMHEIKVKVV